MAVKFGVAFGCEVYVISRSKAKEKEALALGAKVGIVEWPRRWGGGCVE
jgi:D-arabinose 1-dehydrogenase-like Zn-dependent alcohol dehydrogenase